MDGFNVTEASFTGEFRNINTVLGGPGSDTLTGLNADCHLGSHQCHRWHLHLHPRSELLAGRTLVGGNANDTLTFAALRHAA